MRYTFLERSEATVQEPAGRQLLGDGFQLWLVELVFLAWFVVSLLILCLVFASLASPVRTKWKSQAATENIKLKNRFLCVDTRASESEWARVVAMRVGIASH